MGEIGKDGDDEDPVLAAEREHLARSREFLRLMRENVLALPAMAADRVSLEYLKADLYRRAEALRDLPDTPLFFGRLDYAAGGGAPEQFHIGRRHVHDPEGKPVVIDWRAPVSRPFCKASQSDPMGVSRRRRFGFSGGSLTAYEDEPLGLAAPRVPASKILIEEIERPRSGAMRDIVATISPDQDDIVRADATSTICVQGAPGTGKTAVGLHRVAYLLYAHRERMSRGGVLVVGPNQAFLGYIRNVLPALGEFETRQASVTELVARVPVRAADPPEAARVKGDARMAEVLRSALWRKIREPAGPLLLPRGSRRWRLSTDQLAALAAELRDRGVRYGTGRDMLGHRIAHLILSQMEAAGEACDDRTHDAVRRTAPVRGAVDAIWPKADPVRLVFGLLTDAGQLRGAARDILDSGEIDTLLWNPPPRAPASACWSPADVVLIDEAADLIDRTASLAHVVLDEGQDLSPMACRAIGRRCATGSATVLGDLAQGTTPWAAANWDEMLGHLGKPEAKLEVLDTGYRVPRQILDFASLLLGQIAPGLAPARSLRQDPGALILRQVPAAGLPGALELACRDALAWPGSAAVISADHQIAELAAWLGRAGLPHAVLGESTVIGDDEAAGRIELVPVSLAKGLEFDQVVVVEPASIMAAESRGPQRLYVALTRAVSRLVVLHTEALPPPLG